MPHVPSRLRQARPAALALATVAALLLAACSDTLTRAPMPDDGQLERLAVNVGPTEQLIAALEQELADGATPPGPYVSMINQLRTALRLAGEGKVEQGERLVMRVGERIAGLVGRGQMDAGLADTLLDIVDAIVAEEDVCAPTILEGDAIVTDATLLGWSTSPVTHVTGSVIIDGLTATDIDVLPCLERVDGDVAIMRNDDLVMLHAFDRLASVGSMLQIGANPALTALPMFPALESANDVSVITEPALERIEGFNAMITVERVLRIDTNSFGETVTLDGFYELTTVRFLQVGGAGTVIVVCPSLQAIESGPTPPECVDID